MTDHKKNKVGQPTVMTEETLHLLKQAFKYGASDREACAFAEIAPSTLYDYQKANPEYAEQKATWKEEPIIKARKSVVEGLVDNPDLALRFLERKKKNEFSLRSELTGKDGEALPQLLVKFIGDDNNGNTVGVPPTV